MLDGQAACETAYPDCEYLHADVNGDGVVDFDDLDVFLGLVSSGNAALWVAYTWDGENRLIGVEPAGAPKSGDLKLAFVYDYMGRRVQKKVWTHNGSSWGDPTEHRKFVWNGWLLLMELDGLNDDAVLRKRTWGLDLSGLTGGGSSTGLASSRSVLEGAGGIGGLLAVHDAGIGQNGADYVYFYDANGNVGQVVDLSHTPSDPAGAIVARYEYDPYGNVTSQSGAYAAANPFRFSTKYWDDETGLGYWGYRYYDPKLGRWVNRDPIGEVGGENLLTYVENHAVAALDPLGYSARAVAACPARGAVVHQAPSETQSQDVDPCDACRANLEAVRQHPDIQEAERRYLAMDCVGGSPPLLSMECVEQQRFDGDYRGNGKITIRCDAGAGLTPERLRALIIHEIVHAEQECRGEKDYSPDKRGEDLKACQRAEAEAYIRQCLYHYGSDQHDRETVIACCEEGVAYSCPRSLPDARRRHCSRAYAIAIKAQRAPHASSRSACPCLPVLSAVR